MRAALLLACVCWACESATTPTQTIVVVDADPNIQALATDAHARVMSETDRSVRFDQQFDPEWPVRLAVVPLGGDAGRSFDLTFTALRADGTPLVHARVHTSFVKDAKRYHHVLLSEDCIGHPCGPDSTCREGRCVNAHVEARALALSACLDSSCRESSGAEDGGERDAAADSSPNDSDAAPSCSDMELTCAGQCVARDSLEHCGACDHACTELPNVDGETRCDAGRCAFDPSACSEGHGDCNKDPIDGCEIELNQPKNCGACGETCDPPQLCAATDGGHGCVEQCTQAGHVACDGSCVDLSSDPHHCGACGAACESGARCEAGGCTEPCAAGAACTTSECRGAIRCEANEAVCDPAQPVRNGLACGASGSCRDGRCTCGISDGRGGAFFDCSSDADCSPGTVCSDWNGSGQYLCRPLCESRDDCSPWFDPFPDLRCSAALCSDGSDPGIRVCVELDGYLAPAYDGSRCCGGPGSEGVSADGCSDGSREAFTDLATYPSIAGCAAKWPLASMRAAPTESAAACGNSLGVDCIVPADACATGWHVCGTPPYGPLEISNKLTVDECDTQPGRFAMALADTECERCTDGVAGTGAACCGVDCVRSNKDCVFERRTSWFGWDPSGRIGVCGAAQSTGEGQGVMCCRGYL